MLFRVVTNDMDNSTKLERKKEHEINNEKVTNSDPKINIVKSKQKYKNNASLYTQ